MKALWARATRRHAGYTLVEMAIVAAIVGVVGAIGAPHMLAMLRRGDLDEAVSTLVGELRAARTQATSQGAAVVIGLNTSARTLTMNIDRDGSGTYGSDERSVVTISDSRGVSVTSTSTQGVFSTQGAFTCSNGYWKINVLSEGAGQEFVYVFAGGQVERSKSAL